MKTKLKLIKWITIPILVASATLIPLLTVVSCSASKDDGSGQATGTYNDLAMNLSESSDEFDIQTLNWYKQNTASLFIGEKLSGSGSMGTIWNYPTPAGKTGYYFATNIHVVSEALVPAKYNTYTLSENYQFRYSLDRESFNIMPNVQLYKISTQAKPSGIAGNWSGDYYADFVIFNTSINIFKTSNNINFMDTNEEFQWLKNNVNNINKLIPTEQPIFYTCGWPALNEGGWPAAAAWVNVKYVWNKELVASQFTDFEFGTKSEFYLDYLSADDPRNFDFTIGDTSTGNYRYAKSFAYELHIPQLNMSGGSSGSLVSVKYLNPNTNKYELMILGIYWGGFGTTNSTNTNNFLGVVDLFYTSEPYEYSSMLRTYGKAPAYKLID